MNTTIKTQSSDVTFAHDDNAKLAAHKDSSLQKCIHYDNAHCKYKELCQLQHFETICNKQTCGKSRCKARHPKECSYYIAGYCKFGTYCDFKHSNNSSQNATDTHVDVIATFRKEIASLKDKNDLLLGKVNKQESEIDILKTNQKILKKVKEK